MGIRLNVMLTIDKFKSCLDACKSIKECLFTYEDFMVAVSQHGTSSNTVKMLLTLELSRITEAKILQHTTRTITAIQGKAWINASKQISFNEDAWWFYLKELSRIVIVSIK